MQLCSATKNVKVAMNIIRNAIRSVGLDIVRYQPKGHEKFPPYVDEGFRKLYTRFRPYSMLQWIKMFNAYQAVRYISRNKIAGDIVECGVWRGGCMALMLSALVDMGDTSRNVYLYDTFEGMPPPTKEDKHAYDGKAANEIYKEYQGRAEKWAYGSLDDVQDVIALTKYPLDKIQFVRGKVEDTIPETIPQNISLLRLDTDWYASTKHEMEHLYPRLVKGGVLIVDDYGVWTGSGQAVDEYFQKEKAPCFFFDESSGAVNAVKI